MSNMGVNKKLAAGSNSNNSSGSWESNSGTNKYPPLEERMVEDKTVSGAITKFPALNKRFADSFHCIQFYLPSMNAVRGCDETALLEWMESMDIYRSDLLWLLKLPHHKFWSFMIYSKSRETLLSSFLLRAIRPHDVNFDEYQTSELVWPIYCEIYSLIFKVFMRICVYKESPAEHITPSVWASWLIDHGILSIAKILDICTLYNVHDEPDKMLVKMLENIFKNVPQTWDQLDRAVPIFVKKLEEPIQNFGDRIRQMVSAGDVDEELLQELLAFQIDSLASYNSLIKHYLLVATSLHSFPHFEQRLASAYDSLIRLYGNTVNLLTGSVLHKRLQVYRQLALQLFRTVLTESTIYKNNKQPKAQDVDSFLACLTSCVDEKTFTYDYTKAYPFPCDIADLTQRGMAIDDTRINYLMSAISECWRHFGEHCDGSAEMEKESAKMKKVTNNKPLDPLDDPDFDRQLLGACSLEISGVELDSLITNVKDIFADLPNRYIEVCLKHYGYSSESVINAILNQSVPPHLEEYKNETVSDPIPATNGAEAVEKDVETFHEGKWSSGFKSEREFLDRSKVELKTKIFQSLTAAANKQPENGEQDPNKPGGYVDESFFPTFEAENEYDSEYDDTYDDVAVGSTEPESWLYNPLNAKADEVEPEKGSDEEESEQSVTNQKRQFDHFVEDPAVVRERMERRRAEKNQHKKNYVPDKPRDLVGKPKGQGQDKEVVRNRRFKEMHGNQNRAKGADRKRRDF